MPLTRWIDIYHAHLHRRDLSPHSLLAIKRDLMKLNSLCQAHDAVQLADVSQRFLQRSIGALHRDGLSARSLHRWLSSVRGFCQYWVDVGELALNPSSGLRAPKAPKTLPKVLDTEEAVQFVSLDRQDFLGLRDKAMVELLYSSGLRIGELARLKCSDWLTAEGLLQVLGKGNKTRWVPVGQAAERALQEWLKLRASKGLAGEVLFVGPRGLALTTRALQKRFRVLSTAQGMEKKVHPHMLRHSCASHLLESSGDVRAVQELLGHSSIGTTQIYTHLNFQHLAEVYDKTHPRSKRQGLDKGE